MKQKSTAKKQKSTAKNEFIEVKDGNTCPIPTCNKAEAHAHPRYNELGWDLSSPIWYSRVWAQTDNETE